MSTPSFDKIYILYLTHLNVIRLFSKIVGLAQPFGLSACLLTSAAMNESMVSLFDIKNLHFFFAKLKRYITEVALFILMENDLLEYLSANPRLSLM